MRALDKKLMRDFKRLTPQALAIAMVLACGVATLVLAIGTYRSLYETRETYYERYHFASVFASASRAPMSLVKKISKIDGVAVAEGRIVEPVLLDIIGMNEPASGLVLSIPDHGPSRLNRLFMNSGHLPQLGKRGHAVVSEAFASEHGFKTGSTFTGTLAGQRVEFYIAGIAKSPEFIYAMGPGDFIPDHRRFAQIWMRKQQLSGLTRLKDSFNSVTLTLLPGASQKSVITELDKLLVSYGGTGAFPRKDQTSHAFLDSEMTGLQAMAKVIPPIFLFISTFLINLILSRLVALEREQIGTLKALGYGSFSIAMHYIKLVLVIALAGVAIGLGAGIWLGNGLTQLYTEFFDFPFLIFKQAPDIYIVATLASVLSALAGAIKSVMAVARLPAATAMRPATPTQYKRTTRFGGWVASLFSQLTVMGVRHFFRWPVRSGLTTLGTSLAVALLITSMFMNGSMAEMVDVAFFRTDRQDATISFSAPLSPASLHAVKKLPGILSVEPYRVEAVELSLNGVSRRLAITGKPKEMRLSRILDLDLKPVPLPPYGIVLSDRVAFLLKAKRGDLVTVKLLAEGWREIKSPVVDINQSFMGLGAYMDLDALDRLSVVGPRRSGVYVELDKSRTAEIYNAIKNMPMAASIALQSASLQKFNETMAKSTSIMTTVYVGLAIIIAFGVVYNSARIQLSERARELASLRVLGFNKQEVAMVMITELALITILAQPLGWLLGYSFAYAVVIGFQSDLFRIPFVVEPAAFGWSSTIVITASTVSALIVLRRISKLDMIKVLKTKE